MYEKEMTIWEAYKRFWTNAFNIRGRARRKEYWIPILFNYLIYIVALFLIVMVVLTAFLVSQDSQSPNPIIIFAPILYFSIFLFELISFIPSLTVLVRRFHDVGITGWLVLLPLFLYILMIITLIAVGAFTNDVNSDLTVFQGILMLVFFLVFIGVGIWMFILTIMDSKQGSNKWGPNPKAMDTSRPQQYNNYYYNDRFYNE